VTKTPEFLTRRCEELVAGAGAATEWVRDVRGSSQRLDREADGLIERLRRSRNLARRLGAAAARPMSVGFFGLSQAGKSYLISALAANAQGELETVMDGQRLNFISHINPPGDGKEATGLVTRFTRHRLETPPERPVVLTLFSESDLIKILGNSFFNDFDHQRVEFRNEPDFLAAHVSALEAKRQPAETGGMTAEDVVDVMDYFLKRFPSSMKIFEAAFFPAATELAPRLLPADRAELFSVLWGGIADLTATYRRFRDVLQHLGHARRVAAPVDALVRRIDGQLSQKDSIMNVDLLQRFGRDDSDLLEVAPAGPDGWMAPVGVPRSLLAGLAMEMLFELADQPQATLLQDVDLLDFPGYRGRLDVVDLDEVRRKLEGRDPVAELILRGKVAYLFERYTDDQEMNVLVLCTPCHKQSDVNALGPALEAWINSTQGETPDQRARRRPGLVWAITMFDHRLAPKPGETADLMRGSWAGMMRLTLLERFEKYEWVAQWGPSKPFDNIFLVRKRGMAQAVITTKGIEEAGIKPDQQARMGDLRRTFLEDPSVQRHVADPAAAWDGVIAINDGGMGRLAAYLEQVALPQVKLDRIGELVDHITQDLARHQLGAFFRADGAGEVERKTKLAEMVMTAIKARPTSFAELLRALQPNADTLRSLYLRADSTPGTGGRRDGRSGPRPREWRTDQPGRFRFRRPRRGDRRQGVRRGDRRTCRPLRLVGGQRLDAPVAAVAREHRDAPLPRPAGRGVAGGGRRGHHRRHALPHRGQAGGGPAQGRDRRRDHPGQAGGPAGAGRRHPVRRFHRLHGLRRAAAGPAPGLDRRPRPPGLPAAGPDRQGHPAPVDAQPHQLPGRLHRRLVRGLPRLGHRQCRPCRRQRDQPRAEPAPGRNPEDHRRRHAGCRANRIRGSLTCLSRSTLVPTSSAAPATAS